MSIIAPPLRPAPTSAQAALTPSKTPLRPSSISRRSTLKRSLDETNLANLPSSPTKKPRVKFDTDVDILSADDEQDVDPLVVKEQLRRAIERHLSHDHESYESIRSLFTTAPEKDRVASSKILRYHIQALETNVTRLRKECGSLVQSVVSSEWVGRDDIYVATFVRFLGSLAVAQGGYLNTIMSMLVDLLGPEKTRRIPYCKVVRQPKIHRRVLETIRYITQLVPLASTTLAQRLSAKLDFEFRKADERMTYVQSFMQLIQYTPEVTSEILTSILRQLIKLDAAIQIDLDGEDDDMEDDILQHMSSSQTLAYSERRRLSQTSTSDEDEYASPSEDSESEDEEVEDEATARHKKIQEDVRQVDMIMDMLFEYYAELTSTPNLEARDNAVEQLIAQFNNLILPTYRSRHPQFLIFHFAQADPTRVDRFVTNCISILLDQKYSPVVRHAAAAYFSGFVGRGKNVSPALVHDCLDLLCDQLDDQRQRHEPTCLNPDLKKYGDFYAMFQAVMYIFCFRWKELDVNYLSDGEDSDFEDSEDRPYELPYEMKSKLQAAIYSRLNPLRVCTPEIVDQFAKITHALGLFFLYPKIDENKRVRVATSWRSIGNLDINAPDRDMSWVGENGMLEGYFPYDPYHLPISKHWIESDYVQWQGIPGEVTEDSDSEDDDDIGGDEYDMLDDVDNTVESDDDS